MTTLAQGNPGLFEGLDTHEDESREAQRRADKWMIAGTLLMGTACSASSVFLSSSGD